MLSSDFIVMGVAEIETGNHRYICDALLTSLHNPRRSLVESVLLTSNNKRQTNFILVGPARDERGVPAVASLQALQVRDAATAESFYLVVT